ncbi:Clp protease ClpP [Aquimarina algiphila]|uniref:Clp protease ClpP n=1 Tax=Aquimarina algiphila TaxID=2047982 RepID=A0A554VE22_9FLAO|nr:Clp protease ClpP [Aquimarina algiphila]TSE05252.1 Clp protease ClpP [Aquimarina algiphila]
MSIGTIYIVGDIGNLDGKGITLESVIAQVNANKDAPEYLVKIKSLGGSVEVGFDIHNYLKSLDKPVTTLAIGEVASIASVIFMAGTKRIMLPNSHLLIHNPWLQPQGGYEADHLITLGNDLKKTESELVDFYAKQTGNTKEAISPLMRDETTIDPKRAKELGFATEVLEVKAEPFAYLTHNKKQKMNTKKKKSFISQFMDALKDEEVLNLVIKTADGSDLDFPELEDGDTIMLGAKATIDGEDAQGEYLMATGQTFVFESGELTEIKEEEMEEEASFDPEKFKQEVIEAVSTIFNKKIEKVEEENKSLKETIEKREKVFASLKALASKEDADKKGQGKKPGEHKNKKPVNVLANGIANRKNK